MSIGEIVKGFRNSQHILMSKEFKIIESKITSEELPIVMFLTGIREEMENQHVSQRSDILKNELAELFAIVAP